MGGKGSGRPPGIPTLTKKPEVENRGNDFNIPNLSGDFSRGRVRDTATEDLDPVNKKYVDDAIDTDLATHADDTSTHGVAEVADVATVSAEIDGDITTHTALTDAHHAESHSIASHSDTSATGAELDTLTDNSVADTLHRHSELVASDGSPDPALSVDAAGNVGIGTTTPSQKLHVVGNSYFVGDVGIRITPSYALHVLNDYSISGTDTVAVFDSTRHNVVAQNSDGNYDSQWEFWNNDVNQWTLFNDGGSGGNYFGIFNAGYADMILKIEQDKSVTFNTDDLFIEGSNGNVGIGTASPNAKLEIDGGATEGKHLLELDQDDDDEPFIKFDGTSAADQTKNISTVNGDGSVEGPKNYSSSAGWAFEGMVRVDINGTDYWMPYFSADTS